MTGAESLYGSWESPRRIALIGFTIGVLVSLSLRPFIGGEEIGIATFGRAITAGIGSGIAFYVVHSTIMPEKA